MIDLLARLPKNVRLVWVGDGRLRGEFEAAAARAGVTDRLIIEGWRTDARSRMAGFDIFVLPSLFEGLPLAVLEAMSAGLPCLVSDTDGTREALVDRECGRLLPPGDLPAWLAALNEVMQKPELRARWAAAAAQRHRAHFSVEAMARATVAVYREVIAQVRPV